MTARRLYRITETVTWEVPGTSPKDALLVYITKIPAELPAHFSSTLTRLTVQEIDPTTGDVRDYDTDDLFAQLRRAAKKDKEAGTEEEAE
jgi:hypothetical protein